MNKQDVDYTIYEAKDAINNTVGEMARKIDLLDKLEQICKLAKAELESNKQ